MANEIHVEIRSPQFRADQVRIEGLVQGHSRWRRRNGVIFFEVPAAMGDGLAIRGRPDDLHDAFLQATIWSALETGQDLVIHGRVSQRLLTNLERYQDIVCRWWPEYRQVSMRVDEEVADAVPVEGRVVLAFSGGLDGIESLWAHRSGLRGRNTLDVGACVFVHGFDIPSTDPAYKAAFGRARAITDHFGVRLLPLRCNLKSVLPCWTVTHGAGVSAAPSLLERRFPIGLLAGSLAYENFHGIASNQGSTPLTDPLLSSASFQFVHDLELSRLAKTACLLREAVVWKHLRVCWQGEDLSTNCGACEKCVRQMLCMLACGVEDFSAFAAPLDPALITTIRLPSSDLVMEWERCYAHAAGGGLERMPEFVAMRQVLDHALATITRHFDTAHPIHPALPAPRRRRLTRKLIGLFSTGHER